MLRAFAARTADEPGHAATGAGNQPAATAANDTARTDHSDAGFSHATGYNAAWYYAASYKACAACGSGTEHAARDASKPESAAADCAVWNNGKSVASAAESGNYVS